jgi:hypothetical protein
MPYKVKQSGKGWKVVTPNHPRGFSKKPMSKARAQAQLKAIYSSTKGK